MLAFFMMLAASASAVRLAELQIFDSGNHRPAAVDDLIDTESIPAQRGIIMDRNEELLTNNIQSAELVADRYHLREITAVVEGLAYNHAVNDPRWESTTDPKERRKLIYNYRARLLNNAKVCPRYLLLLIGKSLMCCCFGLSTDSVVKEVAKHWNI